jgi:hypothetical protein
VARIEECASGLTGGQEDGGMDKNQGEGSLLYTRSREANTELAARVSTRQQSEAA